MSIVCFDCGNKLDYEYWCSRCMGFTPGPGATAMDLVAGLTVERDRLKAEVERLRNLLRRCGPYVNVSDRPAAQELADECRLVLGDDHA